MYFEIRNQLLMKGSACT